MRKFKSNQGITLVELIVAIAVGSIVTLAVLSLFLMGLRLHRKTTDTALRQNEIQVAITLMEKLITENTVVSVQDSKIQILDEAGDEQTLLRYDDQTDGIYTGSGTQILEDVKDFRASKQSDTLIQLTIQMDEGEEPKELYVFSIYCRMMQIEETQPDVTQTPSEGSATFAIDREPTPEAVVTQTLEDSSVPYGVRQFLGTLVFQLGSTGCIRTADGEGEYFSQWYIGSYEENPGWSQETPWCACFVSWALEENSHLLAGAPMRFANVDAFWAEFVTGDCWKTQDPEPGDIIFFDWIVDSEPNPQHVGVVVSVSGEWVYTIEGNTEGLVALRKYLVEDARILGYGIPNWR